MSNFNAFYNSDRIGAEIDDNSQRNMENDRYTNYMLTNYFNESTSNSHIMFATSQPSIMTNSIGGGVGISGSAIEQDSELLIKTTQQRSLEKLQLIQRPFITVPYLGRGSCDPAIESQLQQGETIRDNKSISTISENTYIDYETFPMNENLKSRINNPAFSVEEAALDGWVRGGIDTRDNNQILRPNNQV